MEEHWRTNCTGNRHCDISFKEYMELKQKPEAERDIFTRLAIHRYELRIENLINRVKHIRETAKKIRAVNIIAQKWLEYIYHPDAQLEERNALLKEIYTPSFSKLKKGTKEYLDLGKSGKVWENYFRPFEWRAQDYDFYAKNSGFMDEISVIKDTIEIPVKDLLQRMIVSFSHQSCVIEGNSLGSAESQIIWEKMNQDYNIDDLQREGAQLPEPKSLLDKPGKEIEVVEIRNHLLATHYLYNTLLKSEQEINIDNIKKIHHTLLKDTPQERVNAWGKIQQAGMFRTMPMQAVGYHLTVYPYGEEVPALTERFVQFYNKTVTSDNVEVHEPYQIHPLMNACRILSSILHIHPFYDGNGRVGRLLMALYLARGGFPPLVFQQLDRKEYADALYKAQAEKDM
ncbi:4124_t:CDS:2, partial [Paraglomus brasilianum]